MILIEAGCACGCGTARRPSLHGHFLRTHRLKNHCHRFGDPVFGDELLAQGVWNGAVAQVGTQHGSGDGGAACVITSSRKHTQKSLCKIVRRLHHGQQRGWETVFLRAGLAELRSGFGRAQVLALENILKPPCQLVAEFGTFPGAFLHTVDRTVQVCPG